MELSICTTFAKERTLEEVIALAKQLNINAIEIWNGHIDEFIKRNRCTTSELKRYLDKQRIFCSAISPYFDFSEENKIKESIVEAEIIVEYAKALDCKIIRTFLGRKPSRSINSWEWERCIEALKYITSKVKDSDICFAIETHNEQPSDTSESILYVLEKVNSSNLKVIFDGFNFHIDSKDMMKEYWKLKDNIIHYHLKNYIWKNKIPTALDKGDVDFTYIIREAMKNECYMSFEYFCANPSRLILDSVKWIEKLKE